MPRNMPHQILPPPRGREGCRVSSAGSRVRPDGSRGFVGIQTKGDEAAELEAAPQDDLPRPGPVLALGPDDLDALFTAGQSDVFEVDRLSGRPLFVRFVSDHEGDGGLVSGDNARVKDDPDVGAYRIGDVNGPVPERIFFPGCAVPILAGQGGGVFVHRADDGQRRSVVVGARG